MVDLPADDFADSVTDTSSPMGVLGVGQSVAGNIEAPSDSDLFRMQLEAGVGYQIKYMHGTSIYSNLYYSDIYLLDFTGQPLRTSYRSQNGAIIFTPQVSGTYYFNAREPHYLTTGPYVANLMLATGIGSVVSIADAIAIEGNTGLTTLQFAVTRTGGTGAFSVDFETRDGFSLAGLPPASSQANDYIATAGTLSFA